MCCLIFVGIIPLLIEAQTVMCLLDNLSAIICNFPLLGAEIFENFRYFVGTCGKS